MERSLAKKASRLHVTSLALAEGMKSGAFKSLYRGQGVEFSGVREYLAGDDVRAIDWNVTARMGRPFVQLFEEERELCVFVVLDASASMRSGSAKATRLSFALECAELLSLAALHNASPVGAAVFDGGMRFSYAPQQGSNQVMMLLSKFASLDAEPEPEPAEPGSALEAALQAAARMLSKKSLVMVFSDFRAQGWMTPFARLCQKHDVVAVRIADAADRELPQVGTVPFVDRESQRRFLLPTSSAAFARAWGDYARQHVDSWQHECLRHGGIPLLLDTSQDAATELTRFFAKRERR